MSASSNDSITARYVHGSAPAHVNDARDLKDLKDKEKARGTDEQVTGETEAAAEGEQVTVVSCVRPYPIQPTSTQSPETSPAPTTL